MGKKYSKRIKYQESGGGWGNPLMGRVFDSEKDIPEEERDQFDQLAGRCDLSLSGELPGQPAVDAPIFELSVEDNENTFHFMGDLQRADDHLRALIVFIQKHCRQEAMK